MSHNVRIQIGSNTDPQQIGNQQVRSKFGSRMEENNGQNNENEKQNNIHKSNLDKPTAEEKWSPDYIEQHLYAENEQACRILRFGSLEVQEEGDPDHDVQDGPDNGECPLWGCYGGFVEALVPGHVTSDWIHV